MGLLSSNLLFASGTFEFSEAPTSIRITGHTDPVGALVIPSHLNGKPVTSIEFQAFKDCTELTSIVMPDTITIVSHAAFSGCSNLVSVRMPDTLHTIRNNVFQYCPKLRDCVLPAGLTSLGTNTFVGCFDLTNMRIPDGLNSIPWGTFYGCSGLTEVTIPEHITSFGMTCFYQCHKLTHIDLPSNLTHIGSQAFHQWDRLEQVSIPAGVTLIEPRAFNQCTALRRVDFQGNAPSLQSSVFQGAANGFTIFFFNGASGFTTPTWQGYPSVNMGDATPEMRWLTRHGQPHDANMIADQSGGVTLLMAYALDLNPKDHLSGQMPQPKITPDGLQLGFRGNTPGITYLVEQSSSLDSGWTADGVILSEPGPDGIRTATVPTEAPGRFLSLTVRKQADPNEPSV